MQKSESIGKLAEALAKAQSKIRSAKKTTDNPFFHKKYADLDAVIEASREALSENGLAVIQPVEMEGEFYFIETTLLHSSGEWISSRLKITPMKQVKDSGWVPSPDPQSIGVAISYGRRYAYQAMICGAAEDDDGNRASGLEEEGGKKKARRVEKETPAAPQGATENCPCGDPLSAKNIEYYDSHPDMERLCFACSTRKKKKEPYGPNRPKANGHDFLSSMADMRAKLGDSEYFLILGRHGVETPEEITERKKQIEVFKELAAKLPKEVA